MMGDLVHILLAIVPILLAVTLILLGLTLWWLLVTRIRLAGSSTNTSTGDMLERVLVPEIRALRESVESLRADLRARDGK